MNGHHELHANWRVVLASAMGAAAGITGMSVYSLSILIGPLSDAFGWSRAEVSGAKTVLTAGFVLTGPFVGYLADRIGVRQIGILSLALLSVGMFSMTQLGPDIRNFYLALFLLALVGCGTTALVWTRAVSSWFDKTRGIALALTLTGPGLIGVITPQLLDLLIQKFDWRAAYITMGIFAGLTLIPLIFFFYENRSPVISVKKNNDLLPNIHSGLTLRQSIRCLCFWQFGFGFLLIGSVVSALMVHLVPLITDAGLGRTVAVRVASALGFAVIVGRMATGFLVDRFHPPYVAAVFLIMPAFGCGMLIAEPDSILMIIIAVCFIGLAAGSEVDLVPYLTARYFGLRAYGRIYSWMFVAFYVGVGFGPLFLGYMYDIDGSYTRALQILVPVLACGVFSIATMGSPPKHS